MSVSLGYQLVSQNLDRSLASIAQRAPVRLESTYYLENYRNVTSIDEFLDDTRLFRFAMEAFGLSDLAFAKGYMRKILEEGVSDPNSLANRSTDARLAEFARTFDFEGFGDLTMTRASTGQAVVDRYIRQNLEEDAGNDDEGIRLALYFERQIANIDTPLEILADAALSEVVRTVLGLPTEFAGVDVERQADVISERVDLEELKTPEGLDRFLARFTALRDAQQAPTNPVLSLFGVGSSTTPTISLELALSFQSFRLGG